MELTAICIYCEHYEEGTSCKAFKEIPAAVWSEGNDHNEPLEGQENGIIFKESKALLIPEGANL